MCDPQRRNWLAQRVPHGFGLTKPNGEHAISAVCEVWSHPDGWELRMVIDGHGVLLATVDGSVPKMLAKVEKWLTASQRASRARRQRSDHESE